MSRVLYLALALLGCSNASALTLGLTSPITSPQAVNETVASTLFNNLQLGSKVSNLTFEANCNGPETGVNLNEDNCQDAVSHGIPDVTDRAILEYGDRRVGKFDVNIPQRYISGDGHCIIDVTLQDVHKETPYYPFGLALASTYVIAKCIKDEDPPRGGTVESFDASRNIRVSLQTYKPNAVCIGSTITSDIRPSCQSLLDAMSVSETPISFGWTRRCTVQTPYKKVSEDGICRMEIDTSGVLSDTASWRDFWEVGVALNGMCIRKGRDGLQINIGAAGNLHMELMDNRNLGGTASSS